MPNAIPKDAVFPADKLRALLSNWWDSKTKSPLKSPMKTPASGTVFAVQPELSSQQAVGVLVFCKAILGYRPSKDVIQKGGYLDKTDFVNNLLSEIQKEFGKKQGTQTESMQIKGVTSNAAITV